mmetsp:Transcript_23586/g.42617  ORF Transcript_23586/g.42617 Transcript_23586/m.42617 type:complete len:430 (+) Transcript_23586:58-1347(+)|eukprot:CAMPEP_0197622118 /NCGR_PEP_ID=MMETSP1338-20131121/2510_1 /TAXON_ID=43686 ORGANISM="Pelagodinium beii, Strain RCC1491" /NCGR_SAMPLE_ID=MMETSP1338 /ASSEMBLY_ACC=CAM_ASM_000754 /LENGTH=429 /DNA_ID=CAMNT_0043191771 /DNA_START=52 /DNA_END=1341 /DNA_ORIENTATION=+
MSGWFSFGAKSLGSAESLPPSPWPTPLASSGSLPPSAAEVEAERLWWAEASERQVEDLSKAVKLEQAKLHNNVDDMKVRLKAELREDMAALTDEFALQISSLEQRLRREQQSIREAALEATMQVSSPQPLNAPDSEALRVLLAAQPRQRLQELTSIVEELVKRMGSVELRLEASPASPKRVRTEETSSGLDAMVEDISVRLDVLTNKSEKSLANALADERAARGKALAELWKYTEHITSLLESDARTASHRTKSELADLSSRLKALEEHQVDQIWRLEHSNSADAMTAGDPGDGMKRPSMSTAYESHRNTAPTYSATSSERPSSQFHWNSWESEPVSLVGKMPASDSSLRPSMPPLNLNSNNRSTSSMKTVDFSRLVSDASSAQREYDALSASNRSMVLPQFSEEMKEKLKHIVRKVGDTMGADPKPER